VVNLNKSIRSIAVAIIRYFQFPCDYFVENFQYLLFLIYIYIYINTYSQIILAKEFRL